MRYACLAAFACLSLAADLHAKPAHLKALADYVGPGLAKKLNDCQTCHLPEVKGEEEKPHNVFGQRIAAWRAERKKAGLKIDIALALDAVADEDADKDGVANLTEILAGRFPGDSADVPTATEKTEAVKKLAVLRVIRSGYAWAPFDPVKRPAVPQVKNAGWVRNPIDAFVAEQHEKHGLKPRPEAAKAVLLRRVYLDLTGLPPTRDEMLAFQADASADAYEKVVDQLMRSPRYGEAQARHWMDVWRYSDWAGFGAEVRDSQPHVWRWRDWIVEGLNGDRSYDRMVKEMLAADEIAPEDPNTLRATGYLVRNWYKFSREVWLDRIVEHTGKAFLGVTINCSRCHDHMYDPIAQTDYYAFRAIFAPHDIRTDRVPGQADLTKDGVVHVFDANPAALTYLFVRGNDADPDKTKPILPAVPASLQGAKFDVKPVPLPALAVAPDNREFVIRETREANAAAVAAAAAGAPAARARLALAMLGANPLSVLGRVPVMYQRADTLGHIEADIRFTELKREVFDALIVVESIDPKAKPEIWKAAAMAVAQRQREQLVAECRKTLAAAKLSRWTPTPAGQPTPAQKIPTAEMALALAESMLKALPTTVFTPRPVPTYPAASTGRRLALANWIADKQNPLTARVAMNHLWLRRFGVGIVPTMFDFGKNGQPPSHPALLDWLAAEFVDRGWSLKQMHRLIVTSAAYRMDSVQDADSVLRDADNKYLWRMNAHRMTAEAVRDSVLAVAGELDVTQGGPEIDQNVGMTSKRRSLYFRHAPEKQMVFLELFDGPNPTECYRRSESVVPQQALALANSPLTQAHSRLLAGKLARQFPDESAFVTAAFETVLSRPATAAEQAACRTFLKEQTALFVGKKLTPVGGASPTVAPAADPKGRARENLVHVLMNHNDFVSVR